MPLSTRQLAEISPQPGKKKNSRFADKLVRVFTRNGSEECILLHVEIQGDTSQRAEFAERMFTYFYRIFDRYRKPVSAVDFPDEDLERSNNPFALVILATKTALLEKKIPETELLERKLLIARGLLSKGLTVKKVRAIFEFLKNYVLFEDKEMDRIFMERINPNDKNDIMGIDEYFKEEGREEGRNEQRRLFVENLLSESDFTLKKIASLANVSVAFVKKVKNNLQVK